MPKEILKNAAASDSIISLNKRIYNSNIRSKRLSITQDDEKDEELRIVGLKVNFDADDKYSIALEKRKCKSDDYLRTGAHSKGVFDNKLSQAQHNAKGAKREFLKISKRNAPTESHNTPSCSINVKSGGKEPRGSPILKLKVLPVSKSTKAFVIRLKSKNDGRDLVSEDKSSYSENYFHETDDTEAESVDTNEGNIFRDGLHCTISLGKGQTTQDSSLPRKAKVTSAATQTEPEFQSTSSQTTSVEIINTRSTQEAKATTQTEGKRDVSTLTNKKKTKTVPTQTDGTPKRQVSVQTEEQVATGSSQTETAAVYSIDGTYGASTEIQELVDTAASTDFDIGDRQNVYDKATDTDDLPHVPWMVTREERTNTEKELTDKKKFECQRQVVAHSRHSQDHGGVMPRYALHSINQQPEISQQPTASSCKNLARNICHCSLQKNCNEINTDKEKGKRPVFDSSRAVINPNYIHSVSQPAVSNPAASEDFRSNENLESDRGQKRETSQYQIFYDGTLTESVRVSSIPPLKLHVEKNSEVCLCKSCFERVRSAVQETDGLFYEQGKASAVKDTLKRTAANGLPTSMGPNTDRIGLHSACETVNDHLLSLRSVDKELLKRSMETLCKTWLEAAGTRYSDMQEVRNYLQYFEEFSFNLQRTILHSVDDNGNNVLHFAFSNNRFDLVEELLCYGYAVDLLNKTNKPGNSPLMVCSISQPTNDNDWAIIRKSFALGDVDGKCLKSGQTPLMSAASCGFHDMIEFLLNNGANPNLRDKDGSTALMYAAEHGHEKCIKVLMKNKNCDPSIKDTDGQTACAVALSKGHKNIARFIHMQELEKKRLSKKSFATKRHVWTNNTSKKEFSSAVQRF